jgi:hypothetical protein
LIFSPDVENKLTIECCEQNEIFVSYKSFFIVGRGLSSAALVYKIIFQSWQYVPFGSFDCVAH